MCTYIFIYTHRIIVISSPDFSHDYHGSFFLIDSPCAAFTRSTGSAKRRSPDLSARHVRHRGKLPSVPWHWTGTSAPGLHSDARRSRGCSRLSYSKYQVFHHFLQVFHHFPGCYTIFSRFSTIFHHFPQVVTPPWRISTLAPHHPAPRKVYGIVATQVTVTALVAAMACGPLQHPLVHLAVHLGGEMTVVILILITI